MITLSDPNMLISLLRTEVVLIAKVDFIPVDTVTA